MALDDQDVSPLRVLIKSNTQVLKKLESLGSALTPSPREEFPEYAGTKKATASAAEKEDLAIARLCRYHWKLKHRMPYDHLSILEPREEAACSHSLVNKKLLGTTPATIRRPPAMYLSDEVFCVCATCKERRELELKADRYWLSGNWDKAIAINPKPCELTLHNLRCDLKFRRRRTRVPKDIDWVSPLQKAIVAVSFDDVFDVDASPVLRSSGTMDVESLAYEEEIKRVERNIRRAIGSADWCAEVVIIVSSLQVSWRAYFQSYRTLRFLEAKGVEHFAIDVNADIGADTLDYSVLRAWSKEELLHRDPLKVALKGELDCLVPQVLVDGVPLGTFEEIMTMEDENDLDYVLAREACPNCLYDRHPDSGHCGVCGAVFHDLISTKFLSPDSIRILLKRNEINSAHIKAPTPRDFERRRRQLGFARLGEDLTTWFDPQKMKLFGAPSVGFTVEFD
eukprot:Gregarina_sp_Pseudo_9__73@NODE_104_length_4259_cov_13_977014_g96_i0_p2_GENE_NODE_104_length_4259_cov_13_977014_g96_i0NODE_104_length_4259_cov_13_977014_g96_i0_p2_ORF_typecomplete_len453_score115_24SH3BGR/PF04908_15/0_0078DZR/PF12773_7/2_4e03DZR/PF12773_7/0_14_NODE_104_length_4259_cov_13_977014_g96_i027314089